MNRSAIALWFATVAVAQRPPMPRAEPVYLLGEFATARVECTADSTVLQAFVAGNARATAALDAVVLLRARGERDSVCVVVDVRRMILTGNTATNVMLAPGDILFAPPQPAEGMGPWQPDTLHDAVLASVLAANDLPVRLRASALRETLVRTSDPVVRHDTALAIAALPDRLLAVQHLVAVLPRDPAVVREALVALATMGGDAASAVPELKCLLDHRDPTLRALAAAAVRQIGAAGKQ